MPSQSPEASDLLARARPGGRLGLVLPTFPQRSATVPDSTRLAQMCRQAESAGAAALWACDHIYWQTPTIECLSAVTAAACATSSVTVGSCVLQLPLRQVPAVAKQAASIQDLSGGRLVLGVGIGSHRPEYHAAGAEFANRGARLEAGIAALRHAWSGTGDDSGYRQLPSPGSIPIWIGGSSEAALRRSARIADGWVPLFISPSEYCAALERLDKEADRAGRDPAGITRAIVVFAAVGGSGAGERGLEWMSSLYSLPSRAFEQHITSGTAREVARSISRYFDAGAQHVAVFLTDDEPLGQFEDLSSELAGI